MKDILSEFNSEVAYETEIHAHDEFMFIVAERGVIQFKDVNNSWAANVLEREFLLVPPGCVHASTAMTTEQRHLVFYVDPEYMRFAMRELSGTASRVLRIPQIGVWSASGLLSYMLLAKRELRAPSTFVDRSQQLAMTDHLLLLECLAISLSNPSLRRSPTERHGAALVREIQAFLSGTLDRSPTLDEIAQSFNLSRRHLTRLFAEQTGVSVLDFVQKLRIARAKDLLQHTPMCVIEVAQSVGFQSASHFARVFSDQVGRRPDDWRRGAKSSQAVFNRDDVSKIVDEVAQY